MGGVRAILGLERYANLFIVDREKWVFFDSSDVKTLLACLNTLGSTQKRKLYLENEGLTPTANDANASLFRDGVLQFVFSIARKDDLTRTNTRIIKAFDALSTSLGALFAHFE